MLIYTCIYYIHSILNILYIYDKDYIYNIYNVLLYMAIYNDTICICSIIYDAEVETPILWPPDAKSCLIGKDPDVGKD